MSHMSIEQPEPQTLEADYAAGYDEETGEYQVGISLPGFRVIVNVHPSAFGLVETVLPNLGGPVAEVIEAIVEAREGNLEETP